MSAKFQTKPGRVISDEVSRAIRQDAKAGMTVQELMAKYAIARTTVHRHMLASPRARKKSGSFL